MHTLFVFCVEASVFPRNDKRNAVEKHSQASREFINNESEIFAQRHLEFPIEIIII